jgi:hypothetical protein
MLRHELAVEQLGPCLPEERDQPGQRDLGRVGRAAEHRFAAKHAVELHSVEAADQCIALPAFYRMGVARAV